MEEVLDALAEQHAELDALLAGLDDAGWARPSRCEGWSVADVVLHLSQTDELAVATTQRALDGADGPQVSGWAPAANVDEGAAQAVERDRGTPPADVLARWRSAAAGVRSVLGECDPSTRVVWVAGQLSTRTLAATRLSECWIHTDDVREAFGPLPTPPERCRHIARLAWRTLPYAFARDGRELAGPVAFDLVGPSGRSWSFVPDEEPVTTIRGSGAELCLVAARRVAPSDTGLGGDGPDVDAVLELVRTYA